MSTTGRHDPPAPLPRLSDYPAWHAHNRPESPAIAFGPMRLTYRALAGAVDSVACALTASGVARGDRVAMLTTPRPEYLIVFLALARIGAIWVGLNPRHTFAEHAALVADCKPTLIIGLDRFEDRDFVPDLRALAARQGSVRRLIVLSRDNQGIYAALDGLFAEGNGLSDVSLSRLADAVSTNDPVAIVYTSGSTGRRKGALLTHRNVISVAARLRDAWPVAEVSQINNYPVDHISCLGDVTTFVLLAGGCLHFMERFDPEASLALIERERLTVWGQEVAMFHRLLAHPDSARRDLSSLKLIWFAGAAAPRTMVARLLSFGAPVTAGWGMSETAGGVTAVAMEASLDDVASTVGKALPGFEVGTFDESGAVGPGAVGELRVRGECVMAGYFGEPEATAEAFDDGWLRSGDLATIRPDGAIVLVGRIKDTFKSGGYNVAPREVELAIEEHPDVALVAVVTVPDPVYQEVGHAFVATRPGSTLSERELDTFCRARLANYKVPRRFWLRQELPALAVGKIDRAALGREALASLVATPSRQSGELP